MTEEPTKCSDCGNMSVYDYNGMPVCEFCYGKYLDETNKLTPKIDGIAIKRFILTDKEIIDLYDYFMKRAGYISSQFDEPILEFIKRLEIYIKEEEE